MSEKAKKTKAAKTRIGKMTAPQADANMANSPSTATESSSEGETSSDSEMESRDGNISENKHEKKMAMVSYEL